MRAKGMQALIAATVVAIATLVPTAPPASAHGDCTLTASQPSNVPGPVEKVRGTATRSCTSGHYKLRMAFWIEAWDGSRWYQVTDVKIAQCFQCRNQSQTIETAGCIHTRRYRVHVDSARIFNASLDDVTPSHLQVPNPPFNGQDRSVC
jgi:hypothetical protein